MKLLGITKTTPVATAYRMAFLTNFFRQPLLRAFEVEYDLTRPEWTVLICLAHRDGLYQRDICEITEQPRNTISRAVARLSARDHIASVADPADGRRTILTLLPAGRALYDRTMERAATREREMLRTLSATEHRQLVALLDKLVAAVPDWKDLPP